MTEKIGRHKGAVETLLHEQKELSRLLQIVNSQLERHINALEEAGVDTDQFISELQEGQNQSQERQKDRTRQKKERDKQRNSSRKKRKQSKSDRDKENSDEKDMEDYFEDNDEGFEDRDFSP